MSTKLQLLLNLKKTEVHAFRMQTDCRKQTDCKNTVKNLTVFILDVQADIRKSQWIFFHYDQSNRMSWRSILRTIWLSVLIPIFYSVISTEILTNFQYIFHDFLSTPRNYYSSIQAFFYPKPSGNISLNISEFPDDSLESLQIWDFP